MSVRQNTAQQLVLMDASPAAGGLQSYAGLHAMVPILIGLSIPLFLFTLAEPRALQDTRFIVLALLFIMSIVTAAIFVLSILRPGTTQSVSFHPGRAVADVVRTGRFAHSVYTIPFSRIRAVRIETRYDDDGYATQFPVMVLAPRELIELPATTSPADVAAIRQMIGLAA